MKNTRKRIVTIITMLAIVITMLLPMQAEAKAKPKLSKTSVTLNITDKKASPAATLKLKNVSKKAAGKAVWKSGNKKVATVNKKGKVTAVAKGKTTVTVKVNGKRLSCKVTVLDKRTPKTPDKPSETPEPSEKPKKCSHEWEDHWTVFITTGISEIRTPTLEQIESGNWEPNYTGYCYCGAFKSKEEYKAHLKEVGLMRGFASKLERRCGIHGTKAKTEVSTLSRTDTYEEWQIKTDYIEYMECKKCGKIIREFEDLH